MRRMRVVIGAAVLAAFGAGTVTGWFLATRQPLPGTLAPPAVPGEVVGQPARPPELFGRVEAVRHSEQHGTAFLVRSTKPNSAGWDSEQNVHHRTIDMPCWVGVREGVERTYASFLAEQAAGTLRG